jgi:nucleoside phosphorylase
MPPSFALDDDVAFQVLENKTAFLSSGMIRLPIRESSLGDYIEKKRGKVSGLEAQNRGLFDDKRIEQLATQMSGLTKRKSTLTEAINRDWQEGPDKKSHVWSFLKSRLDAAQIEHVRNIPKKIIEKGQPLTSTYVSINTSHFEVDVKKGIGLIFQHYYLNQYCLENNLFVMTDLPNILEEFWLPKRGDRYSFRRFKYFLESLGIVKLLDADAELIVKLRYKNQIHDLLKFYHQISPRARTREAFRLQFQHLDERLFVLSNDVNMYLGKTPSETNVLTLAEHLGEVHNVLTRDLVGEKNNRYLNGKRLEMKNVKTHNADIVFYIALKEELDVLAKQLRLKRLATSVAASGTVGETEVEVICPDEMGRVPAAVALTKYLAERSANPPKLVLVLGLAGGFREARVSVGNIICVRTVVDLASRKLTQNGEGTDVKFRRRDFRLNAGLERYLTSDEFPVEDWRSQCISVSDDWPQDRRPALISGIVGSVDEVVSSDEWRTKLIRSTDKILGVEMEAGGVCAAAESFGVSVSMLRAISDNADPSKEDNHWRRTGLKALAHVLERISLKRLIELASV